LQDDQAGHEVWPRREDSEFDDNGIRADGNGAEKFAIADPFEPAVMGKSRNVSPFMIVLSLAFWGLLRGIAGMSLSVTVMVILTVVCARFDNLRGIAMILSADGQIGGSIEQIPD
jgi:hypothetical protein